MNEFEAFETDDVNFYFCFVDLNNYLTRVRLSVSLFVCLSVAMVPTLRHLRLRAAQTVTSSWVKFAQFVEDELRHLHVEKRGRWGA